MPARRSLVVLLLCAAAGWAGPAEVRTLKQETITGELVRVTSKEIVVKAASGEVTTPIDEVLTLTFGQQAGALPSNVPWVDVELTDGTQLHCAKFSVKKEKDKETSVVSVTLLSGQEVKFPLSSLSTMLANADQEKNRKAWADVLDKTSRTHDLAAKTTGAGPNAFEGLIGEADETGETIQFTLESGTSGKLALSSLYGLAFRRKANPDAAVVQCRLQDTFHNLVMVSGADSTANGFTVTTPSGAKIDYTPALIVKMDYSHLKKDYLSDLTPSTVEQRFRLVAGEYGVDQYHTWRWRADRNLDDRPLELNNIPYEKGLALHSHTELTYDLEGNYREFDAMIGIEQESVDRPVVVRILADDVEVWNRTFVHGDKEKSLPQKAQLNIKDVKKLRIVVSAPTSEKFPNDVGLKAVLADAYVSK
ncbi:MAG TPA: NPCBM/NEW2 domain-containing protein [Gemmataceae bacterium]|nr:NPCBM/NEW2 domain-containing protein [Gemmataceae bacterium]